MEEGVERGIQPAITEMAAWIDDTGPGRKMKGTLACFIQATVQFYTKKPVSGSLRTANMLKCDKLRSPTNYIRYSFIIN